MGTMAFDILRGRKTKERVSTNKIRTNQLFNFDKHILNSNKPPFYYIFSAHNKTNTSH